MKFINELKNLDYKRDVIDEIRKEKIPLVMWGCGEFADEVYSYLLKHGIELDDVFVDDEYYCNELSLKNKKVISCSELKQKYQSINIILGCSNYEKREILQRREYVNKVFYLFSVNYGIFEKTPFSYIQDYELEFQKVYDLLGDEKSKENFVAFLRTRITGNNDYIEQILKEEFSFFNNDIFRVGNDEVFIDVGAYDGDTIRSFLSENDGKYKYIYALEPDINNLHRLQNYIGENNLKDIFTTELGAWSHKGKISFSLLNEQISSVVLQDNKMNANSVIDVDTLDNMFKYKDKVTLIKINYLEGVKEALEGARGLLKTHCPKLAITVGFDCKNIRSIPLVIKEANKNYKLYLRFNRGMVSALTLYAVVE